MNKVAVGIGSNTSKRITQVNECIAWLITEFLHVAHSSIYETPAVGCKEGIYANAVTTFFTTLSYDQLNSKLKNYELSCGRTPQLKPLGIVPIDIDIVVWNDDVMREKDFSHTYFTIGWNEIIKDNE